MTRWWAFAFAAVFGQGLMASLSWWHLQRLRRVDAGIGELDGMQLAHDVPRGHSIGDAPHLQAADWPRVSVIVPARNEAQRLPGLLASLVEQRFLNLEVIVVDDDSDDGTAECARRFAVRLVRGAPLLQGWTGKNFACWQGAQMATGDWLLFADADTVLAPHAVRSAVIAAQEWRVDLLSLLARQRCECFWESLLLPFAYQHYFVGLGPPIREKSCRGVANGQFLMCRADAYRQAGGHAAVRASVIDDVALAQQFVASGMRCVLARGETLVSVHMYEGLRGIAEGFGKNSFRFLAAIPSAGLVVVVSTMLTTLPLGLLAMALVRRQSSLVPAALAGAVTGAAGIAPWVRLFGAPAWMAAAQPLAAAIFQAIALRSMWQTVTGRPATWKGRAVGGHIAAVATER